MVNPRLNSFVSINLVLSRFFSRLSSGIDGSFVLMATDSFWDRSGCVASKYNMFRVSNDIGFIRRYGLATSAAMAV